ncbi:exodeoxyribonuclease VII small subunit, partial [bacterium]|nr:exodeoxyribonuclease VII small subunit [bacterium]
SFEEGIESLQKIVEELENGNLKLEEGLEKFREATKLASWCSHKLNEVEKNIKILITEDEGFKLEDFENGAAEEK